MPASKPRRMHALVSALTSTLILGSCAIPQTLFGGRTESVDVNAVACRSFKPITWADGDTDETLRQVREHNAAWVALCGARAANVE